MSQQSKNNGAGVASLICGIVGFFFNPLGLVPLAAIITGIVGIAAKDKPKGMAIAGLILGLVAGCSQIFMDVFITAITAGLGFFAFFI